MISFITFQMIPPTEQPQRFGNKSFRVWYQKLKDVSRLHFHDHTQTSYFSTAVLLYCLGINKSSERDAA